MTISAPALDVARIRQDFPVLNQPFHGKPLIYLDSAVSGLPPRQVVDRVTHYQTFEHTNVHRGVSTLSQEATDRFEEAREKVRAFINAPSSAQIIWTRGTTESVNLVAQTFGRAQVGAGDEILLSAMEHHSNIVPWQLLAQEKGARIRVIPMTDAGELILDDLESLLSATHPDPGGHPRLQRAGHHQPGQGDHPPGPRQGRAGAGGRRPGRARTCRWT